MENSSHKNKLNNSNLVKIIHNHINYLENDILVFENVLENFEENKLKEDIIEQIKKEMSNFNHKNSVLKFDNSYYFYLKAQKEDIDRMNLILMNENVKSKNKLINLHKTLDDIKYQVNLVNNEINDVIKQKKILEDKYTDLEYKFQNKNNQNDLTDNQTTNKGEFSMKNLINAQKKEKEKKLKNLKNEILRQEKLLLENKKNLEEKEKRNTFLNSENQYLRESIKQKSLIIEHLYTDVNQNLTKSNLNESHLTSRTPNHLSNLNANPYTKKNIEFDSKSCNSTFSTNTSKKKGFVGFFQNIFK